MGKLWDKSGSIEFDNSGVPADGAIANFFVGGTSTPLTVYQNASESTPHAEDVEADGNGRWPAVFIPFVTSYDVRVSTEGGTQLYYFQNIPNPDPVEASEDTVDASELIQTGDVIWSPVDETRTGFVRCNGRTIGNAASGATERANADTEDLFTFLWNKLANGQAAVSGGRGGSAAADFAANKTITLLDGRAGALYGLDDMGNSAASRYGSATFASGDATTPGSVVGANTHTLATGELPSHTHSVSITTSSDGSHTHTGTTDASGEHTHQGTTDAGSAAPHSHTTGIPTQAIQQGGGAGITVFAPSGGSGTSNVTSGGENSSLSHTHTFTTGPTGSTHVHNLSVNSNGAHTHTVSGNTGSTGSGTAHNIVSYGLLGTFFQKL